MEPQLLKSFIARDAVPVMGRRLRPFSLAHRIALTAFGSPVLKPGSQMGPTDLVFALRVCATANPLANLTPKPTLGDKWLALRLALSQELQARALCEFAGYLAEHTSHPELWAKQARGESDNIDWPLHVIGTLMRAGVSYHDALHMSEGRATWLQVVLARQNGAELSVVSEREKAAMKQLETLNAKKP